MSLDLIDLIHDTRGISGGNQKIKKSRSTLFILSKRNDVHAHVHGHGKCTV